LAAPLTIEQALKLLKDAGAVAATAHGAFVGPSVTSQLRA
jgi:hypothetical protein